MNGPLRVFLNGVIAPLFALGILGCGHHGSVDTAKHGDADSEVVSFSAKLGLRVPPKTAEFIGLHVADADERKVEAALKFTAQVYQTAEEALHSGETTALARISGIVGPAEADLLKEGQAAAVEVDGAALPAGVFKVNRRIQKTYGQAEVLLTVVDEKNLLSQGAFLSVSVPVGGHISGVSVPRSALLRTTEGDFVYTVSGEHFVRAQVKIGSINEEFVEVTDGLYVGDQIVTEPVMTLWLAELQFIRGGKACADGH